MKIRFAVLVWGALALSAGPAWAQSSVADADVVQRPEWSVGDWWEFREKDPTTFRLTVVGRDSDRYVLVRTRSGEPAASAEGKTRLYADVDGWIAKTVAKDGKVTDSGDKRNTEAPKITINYPTPDTKVEREQMVVLGLVTDDVGVDRVQITVNGVEVTQPRDIGVSGRGLPIRVPAALQLGENIIEITATDKAGNVAQVVRTVTRVAPTVAAAPAPNVGNRWAVVIGISEYEHKAIPRLRFAARDAEAMYAFLTTKGGYPKQNVLLLTDTTADKPTLQNIRRALGDFLFRRPGLNSQVSALKGSCPEAVPFK